MTRDEMREAVRVYSHAVLDVMAAKMRGEEASVTACSLELAGHIDTLFAELDTLRLWKHDDSATIAALTARLEAAEAALVAADEMRIAIPPCNARLRGDGCLVRSCADAISYDAARAATKREGGAT